MLIPEQPTFSRWADLGWDPLGSTAHELAALGWWVRHTYIGSQHPPMVTFELQQDDNGLPRKPRATLTTGTTGASTGSSDVSGYAADVFALVQGLNTLENAAVAVLRFDPHDLSGTPLLHEGHDLDLGCNSSRYASFD